MARTRAAAKRKEAKQNLSEVDHWVWRQAAKTVTEEDRNLLHYIQRGADWDSHKIHMKLDEGTSPKCEYCGAQERTYKHIVWECPRFAALRCQLVPALEKVNIGRIPENMLRGIPQAMSIEQGKTFWGMDPDQNLEPKQEEAL